MYSGICSAQSSSKHMQTVKIRKLLLQTVQISKPLRNETLMVNIQSLSQLQQMHKALL